MLAVALRSAFAFEPKCYNRFGKHILWLSYGTTVIGGSQGKSNSLLCLPGVLFRIEPSAVKTIRDFSDCPAKAREAGLITSLFRYNDVTTNHREL
jgi:hypothetical protein